MKINKENIINEEIAKIRKLAKKYEYCLEIGAIGSYEEEQKYKDFVKSVNEEDYGFDIIIETFIKKDYPNFMEEK